MGTSRSRGRVGNQTSDRRFPAVSTCRQTIQNPCGNVKAGATLRFAERVALGRCQTAPRGRGFSEGPRSDRSMERRAMRLPGISDRGLDGRFGQGFGQGFRVVESSPRLRSWTNRAPVLSAPTIRSRSSRRNGPPERRNGSGGVGGCSGRVRPAQPRLPIVSGPGTHRSGAPDR